MERPQKRHLFIAIGVIVGCILAIAVIGYIFHWSWTSIWTWVGLNGGYHKVTTTSPIKGGGTRAEEQPPAKTLWDWLQLVIVPLVLAGVGLWFTQVQKRNELTIASDNQHEKALQDYIDKISELLLKEHLGELKPEKNDISVEQESKAKSEYEKARNIARVRTITVLFQLDARRIGYVFTFLRGAGLMSNEPNSSIVSLWRASLYKINLSQAKLREANLNGAILSEANLRLADLREANLSKANLYQANLNGAILSKANLSGVFLREANLSGADLREADLREANLYHANLSKANRSEANLSKANLRGANLSEPILYKHMGPFSNLKVSLGMTNLRDANLSGPKEDLDSFFDFKFSRGRTNLRDANLSGANLSGANLYHANLYHTNLSGANLREANLRGVNFYRANLDNADFRGARITGTKIRGALSHKGTIKPNGSAYPS